MIKLKNIVEEFLRSSPEGERRRTIDLDQAVSLAKDYSESIEIGGKGRLYRGVRGADQRYYYIDPSSSPMRYSRDVNNIYMALMDTLPAWSGFPKRSHSIIVSTDYTDANSYGALYVVFLKNESKIASASSKDIISYAGMPYLYDRLNVDLEGYMYRLEKLFNTGKELGWYMPTTGKHDYTYKNIEDFYNEMSDLTVERLKILQTKFQNYVKITNVIDDMLKHPDPENGWKNYFNELLSPTKNGITLETISSIKYNDGRECWTEFPAILVRQTFLGGFIDAYNNV